MSGKPASVLRRARMVRRIVSLSLLANGRRYMPSLDDLAEMLEASPRTIRRDLEAFEYCGIDVRWRRHDVYD